MSSDFDRLTPRELQAVGFAALGHSNKLVAYEMGIAPSTVSVLLHRAGQKLGTSSRVALIARYLDRTLKK
jgi:DNA-binding CsgD family transcriptional regulator